jgi:hypothetical protein
MGLACLFSGINSVEDSYSEKLEKIRISKEVIKIFTGNIYDTSNRIQIP